MVTYYDLIKYTKENHISWNEDLFDVLRGFFNNYFQLPHSTSSQPPIHQEPVSLSDDWQAPENGEYTVNDLINLFSK